ncbi:MAG: aldolase [Dactylosporangium sp.]|nr:aldolase [Dactylosporangium sp.]
MPLKFGLDRLQLPGGGFAMLAIDQRESLRAMMSVGRAKPATDDELVAFKAAVAHELTPLASAILIDREFGLRDGMPPIAPQCGIILAADRFVQRPGQTVEHSDLDPAITPEVVASVGASAVKLLIIWRAKDSKDRRDDIIGQFKQLAADAGVVTVLEGVVRPDSGTWASPAHRDDAILAAATEFAKSRPDIYKAEVPGLGQLPEEELTARARAISDVLDCPWVVLSSGVAPDAFPSAVAAALAGGASGFLAGRAVWSESLARPDVHAHLRSHATERLRRLIDVVQNARSAKLPGAAGSAASIQPSKEM